MITNAQANDFRTNHAAKNVSITPGVDYSPAKYPGVLITESGPEAPHALVVRRAL
jgi:hypothetical protein